MDPLEQEITKALDPILTEETSPDSGCVRGAARILFVGPGAPADLLEAVESCGHTCAWANRFPEAVALMESERFELVLLDACESDSSAELLEEVVRHSPTAKLVFVSRRPSAEAIMYAMRIGAVDFFHTPMNSGELRRRLDAALLKSRIEQQRENRLVRLKAICRELNDARHEIAEQLDALCREMASAYAGLTEQMTDVAMASEFRTLVRQELDIEDLLRTSLEYALTKTGPTNAAVFLAEGGGRFSLGAYVNYDCPRETIAEVLERLGSAICPQMAAETEIVSFDDAREFAKWLDIDAGMLAESQVIAFSCMHEGETLAVIVLFRPASKPFNEVLGHAIQTLRPIFAAQLANVTRIHHRAMPCWPKEADGGFGEGGECDFDEPGGYGFGPLAA